MSPEALLREARRLVHDGDRMKDGAWARAAAFLARQALEQAIKQNQVEDWASLVNLKVSHLKWLRNGI